MDAIPVFSQIKSFAQWASGNSKGARETQKNFLKLCPGVSQGTSLVQAVRGDKEGAKETQMQFIKGVSGMVDSMPGVGHVKGVVHYACGDREGGDNAMKAATHTTGVIGGGVVGFLVAGPVGATAGGSAGGALMDSIISVSEVAVNGENAKPYGFVDNIVRIVDNPKDGGNYVDLIGGMVFDGMSGYIAGNGIGRNIKYALDKRKLAKAVGENNAKVIVNAGERMRRVRYVKKIKSRKSHVTTIAKDKVTGRTATGYNKQMRAVLKHKKYTTRGQTELQKRVPGAKQVLKRRVHTCAEQQAYNGLYTERPDASPAEVSSISLRWNHDSQGPVTVPRCDNCRQFSPAMGSVPTDLIPETPVPRIVRYSEAATATIVGVSVRALCKEVGSEEQ